MRAMNKENKSVGSFSSTPVKLSSPIANLRGLNASAKMPHKQIDLNVSKKSSVSNSPFAPPSQSFDQDLPPAQVNAWSSSLPQAATSPIPTTTTNTDSHGQPASINQHNPAGLASHVGNSTNAGTLQKLFMEQKHRQDNGNNNSNNNHHVGGGNANQRNASEGVKDCQSGESFEVDDHGASRRFSMFSKSSFATSSSFLFGTRILNKSGMAGATQTPKVNISSIFKNKAYLYLDEALISTFDDLLDKGHQIVTLRKEDRDILAAQEAAMKAEVVEVEKEIVPLLQRVGVCNEQMQQQKNLGDVYIREIAVLVDDLANLKATMYAREKEVADTHSDLTNTIKQMEIHNNDIRSDIHINKACHRQEANQQAIHIKQKVAEMDALTKQLVALKADYESKRNAQADRLRKMGNKQKMYMGILKH